MESENNFNIFRISKILLNNKGKNKLDELHHNWTQTIKQKKDANIFSQLEALLYAFKNNIIDKQYKFESICEILEVMRIFALEYQDIEKFQKIISEIESKELKENLFNKQTVKASILIAESYFGLYQLKKFVEQKFSLEQIEYLLKSKYYLLKILDNYIIKENKLSEIQKSHVLSLLSGVLTELSRWSEPFYFNSLAKLNFKQNPNIEYLNVLLLDAIKDKTCMDLNYLIYLKIIDFSDSALKVKTIMPQQKKQLIAINKKYRNELRTKNIYISKLRSHITEYKSGFKKLNGYQKYCYNNQLYINEHRFFCNCFLAIGDNLIIQTQHLHTQIHWVNQFESIINSCINDLSIARFNFYLSMDETKLPDYLIEQNMNDERLKNTKNSLLKTSFKSLYSILDQIGHGILKVFNIDYESILKTKFPDNNQIPKIYFINMWKKEFGLFESTHFEENFYLGSLYSISQDINKSDFAALSNFRELRNAMEHKIFYLVDLKQVPKIAKNSYEIYCSKQELIEKTKILLQLTISAIFSFVYLIRRQSKLKESLKS